MDEKDIQKIVDKDHAGKAMTDNGQALALEEFAEGEGLTVDQALSMIDEEDQAAAGEFHPVNDAYNLEVMKVAIEINRRKKKMSKKDLLAVEHLVKNTTIKQIYENTGVLLEQKDFKAPGVQKMASLVSALFLLKTGVTKKARSNLLWRIAVRNELKRPDLSIAAVATINKMFGDNTPVRTDGGIGGGGGLTIIVQNQALANSPLDAMEVGNG
jgi:hypothetical protein